MEDGEQRDTDSFQFENGKIPGDYLVMLTKYHGGAGLLGDGYIDLWEPEEIKASNEDYQVQEFAPGFTIFGSDGGDTAFAFERATGFIYCFPFVGMIIDEPPTLISKSFEDFLNKVKLGLFS